MQGKLTLAEWVKIICISFVAAVGLNILLILIDLQKYSPSYQEAVKILYAPSFLQQILTAGILYPIIEELLFRGIIFQFLRKKLTFVWAMILSATIFGLYHGNLVQFVYAGIIGLLLAYFYEKYDSLLVPIVSHMAMNLIVLILTETNGFIWMLQKY